MSSIRQRTQRLHCRKELVVQHHDDPKGLACRRPRNQAPGGGTAAGRFRARVSGTRSLACPSVTSSSGGGSTASLQPHGQSR